MKKYVYLFGGKRSEGDASMKELLGSKGANLAEMSNIGIPVPPGFTVTTEACLAFLESGSHPGGLEDQIREAVKKTEELMGTEFGNPEKPLLFSIRSGAAVSMPGMMDTVLNIGLNDETLGGLERKSGERRAALDSYRRLLQMFGDVVLKIERSAFEKRIDIIKKEKGLKLDLELEAADWERIVEEFKSIIREATGEPFPREPEKQLWMGIEAVFNSWNNPRAVTYRRLHGLSADVGTAANVQAMVFGNMGEDCATGVAFTRDPATGERKFYGEYLVNAQGEDVVAGIRTPHPIPRTPGNSLRSMEEEMPDLYRELDRYQKTLEDHYRDMQDLEFTIESGKLFMLQTRTGKRTGFAALRIACDMVEEGKISKEEAIMRVEPAQLMQLLAPTFIPEEKEKALKEDLLLAKGLPAGPGAATGKAVFSAEKAVEIARNEAVILVRPETSAEDVGGMSSAAGILTAKGGMTSHAAVVARGMGKPCIVGCGDLDIDVEEGIMKAGGKIVREGDLISIDGTTGEVFATSISTRPSDIQRVLVEKSLSPEDSPVYANFSKLLEWADELRTIGVRTNADTPEDSAKARAFGAEGIGLCRTEHMFFGKERIKAFRKMILSESAEERRKALLELRPYQVRDFTGIFRAMEGLPVTIRLLDPPLHEFLPLEREQQEELAAALGIPLENILRKIEALKESNPMLGHRGCRLGIIHPEIYEMQAEAIFEAALKLTAEGIKVVPEIMIPLVGIPKELERLKKRVDTVAEEMSRRHGAKIEYAVGTMIEIPRATLEAGEIARTADFFSFGTNDLTQMTFGFSRDDAGTFLPAYLKEEILPHDPFQSLDTRGVGELVRIGIERGRKTRSSLKIGVCGEHGGDPASITFFHDVKVDYVSCSPFRVAVARLSAARAAIDSKKRA